MRWSERVAETLGLPTWTSEEASLVLDLARDVAHGTERQFAPLTAYALGIAVGQAMASGSDRTAATRERVAALQAGVAAAEADAATD